MAAKKSPVAKKSPRKRAATAPRLRPVVRYYLYDYHRQWEPIGMLREPYDGTERDAVRAADVLQQRAAREAHGHTHAGSVLVALDEYFEPRWLISPNLAVLTRADSPEGARSLRFLEETLGRKPNAARSAYHVYVQGPGWWDGWDVEKGGLAAASRAAARAVRGRGEVVTARVSRKEPGGREGPPIVTYTNRNADGGVGRVRKTRDR